MRTASDSVERGSAVSETTSDPASTERAADVRGEIRQIVAQGDGLRATTRLLDFARDFGSRRDLNSALLLSHRFSVVAQALRDIGSNRDDEAERVRIMKNLLELADQVVDDLHTRTANGGVREPQREPARDAFIAGGTPELSASSNSVVIVADKLKLTRRRTDPRFVLENVSFELRVGEILALIGANGQGKSTLLEIISGRLARESGLLDYPFVERDWSKIKRYIAYMRQSAGAPNDVSETAMRYIAALYGSRGDDNDLVINFWHERLGIAKYRGVPTRQLSGGFQVRFGLARSLLKRPRLLLLDEPLAHLDIPTQSRFLADLRDLSRSPTNPFAVIISSQHLHEIESISDKTLVLQEGRPQYFGSTAAIGANRTEESYEMLADRSADEIGRILAQLGECKVERAGANLLVKLPRGIDSTSVLRCLLTSGVRLSYFRYIGESARSYLQENS